MYIQKQSDIRFFFLQCPNYLLAIKSPHSQVANPLPLPCRTLGIIIMWWLIFSFSPNRHQNQPVGCELHESTSDLPSGCVNVSEMNLKR